MIETMSLKEMEKYRGRQEVPEDFDSFWDKQIQALPKEVDYSLVKKEFSIDYADFYDLSFNGTNGSIVYAKCLFPKTNKKVPVIFYFHGYMGQSPDWSENLKYAAAGYGVVSMDVRGQAGKSLDHGIFDGITVKGQILRGALEGPEHLFFKDVYLDVYQLIEIVASLEFVDENNLSSHGGSQGGALALVAGALNHKIKLIVAIYPFLSDFKRVLELGDNSEAYNELFRYFKFSDPFHETEESFLKTLSYIDVKNLAHLIKGRVNLVTGLQDDVCPPSTQYAIFNRIETEKEIKILPEYGHEAMNVGVNDYVFNSLTGSRIK